MIRFNSATSVAFLASVKSRVGWRCLSGLRWRRRIVLSGPAKDFLAGIVEDVKTNRIGPGLRSTEKLEFCYGEGGIKAGYSYPRITDCATVLVDIVNGVHRHVFGPAAAH
jgi:hypothetical protein